MAGQILLTPHDLIANVFQLNPETQQSDQYFRGAVPLHAPELIWISFLLSLINVIRRYVYVRMENVMR